jgi:hypothetical protein
MMCVVLLQDCIGSVEGGNGCCHGTDGAEEVSIKVEDAIDINEEVGIKFEAVYIKDEVPEATALSSLMTENEVKIQSL